MTLLEKMCEELGVKIGEEWKGNDGGHYKINPSGRLWKVEYIDNLEENAYERLENIERVLTGELKPTWKPKTGEPCYIPNPTWEQMYERKYWGGGNEYYKLMWERGLVYKTKEEAIRCAEEMIALAKHGI